MRDVLLSVKRLIRVAGLTSTVLNLILVPCIMAQSNNSGTAKGGVVDPKKQPLPKAQVTLTNQEDGINYGVKTDGQGQYTVSYLPSGLYTIKVAHINYSESDEISDFPVELKKDNSTMPPVFTLGLTALAGKVTDLHGNGVPDAQVIVIDSNGERHGTKTKVDGSYRIPYLPAGKYTIVVSATGLLTITRPGRIVVNPQTRVGPPHVRRDLSFETPIRIVNTEAERSQNYEKTEESDATVTGQNGNHSFVELRAENYMKNATAIESTKKRFATSKNLFNQNNVEPSGTDRLITLRGKVVDKDGKGLPYANVTVTDDKTEESYATITDGSGNFSVMELPPGSYTITAYRSGYEDGTTTLRVSPSQKIPDALSITLAQKLGPNQNQSQASGQIGEGADRAVLVHTADPARSGNFSEQQLTTLPLGDTTDMRTFDELAFLVPGVAPPPFTPGVRGPGVGFGVGTAGKFSVNGMRARSNNFTVDGSDNNDPDVGVRRQGFLALVPQSIESIKEFQIITLLWDGELGRNFGSQANAVSKYGGNDYHGQAYAFFTDSRLNARNAFDHGGAVSGGKNPFTRTQAGFVVGGPVVRSRTHFFGSFEHLVANASTEQHFSSPASDERRFLGKPRFGVHNPLFGDDPSIVFDTTLGTAPLGRNVLSFYPTPNDPGGPYGVNTYTEILPASGKGEVLSFKLTHQVVENQTVNARYNFTEDNRVLPNVNRAIRSTIASDTRTQDLSLIFNSSLATRVFNQARFSYGRTRLNFSPYPDDPFISSHSSIETVGGLTSPVPSTTGPIGEVVIEPFSPVGVDASTFLQNWVDNTFQFANSTATTWKGHSIKFGGDIHRVQLNSRQERNYRPRVVYGNAVLSFGSIDISPNNDPKNPFPFTPAPGTSQQFVSGLQLATVGLPTSIFQTITAGTPDPTIGLRFTEFSFFFNDNWRLSPNLVLDYGLRYEYNTVPREVNDRIETALRMDRLPTPGASSADTTDRTAAFDNAISAYRQVLGGRTRIYDGDPNNLGPHLGFVWLPRSSKTTSPRTSVRGGYGIYFDAILGALVSQSRNVFPTEIPINVDPTFLGFDVFDLRNPSSIEVSNARSGKIDLIAKGTLNQLGGAPQDFVALIGEVFLRNQRTGGLAFTLPSKNLPTPYAQQWHLTLEHQVLGDFLISAAYVGTKGTKLTRLTTPNLGPNVTIFIPVSTAFTNGPGSSPFRFPGFPKFLIAPKSAESILRPRPIPALGPYQIFDNSASSNYHALQLEARKRYSHNYTFTVAYTWSHAIDDVSDILPIAGAPILPEDSFNFRLERASANYDVRHRLAASLIWDLPFYRNSPTAWKKWLSGWQIASIFQANTGQPFTLNVPVDANFDGNLTDRPSTTEGLLFFHGHGPRRVAVAPGRQVTDFFKFGQDGSVGRNTVRGDSFINLDLALNKSFLFANNKKIEWRTEFFNALNRANFGLPIRTIGAPGFGTSADTVNPARIIQFALKLSF